jgi:hypothetical protein
MRVPFSLIFIPMTGCIVLLGLVPLLNLYLMVFGLPFWPSLTINGGLAALVLEVFTRRLNRIWLMVPLAWFGGYSHLAWTDHIALKKLRNEVSFVNAKISTGFDPQIHDLVEDGQSAGTLVQNYGVSVAFSQRGESYRSVRMIERNLCDKVRKSSLSSARIYTSGFHEESDVIGGGKFESRFCMLSMSEEPNKPFVRMTSIERKDIYSSIPVTYNYKTITMPDGKKHTVITGYASSYGWFPKIAMAYDPLNPSFDKIMFGFARNDFIQINTEAGRFTSANAALAKALGLKRVKPNERESSDTSSIKLLIENEFSNVIETETELLDRALVNVNEDIGTVPFNSLRGRQEVILPRLGRIVTALERAMNHKGNYARNNAQALYHLAEQVPESEIAPYLSRLNSIHSEDISFKYNSNPVITKQGW